MHTHNSRRQVLQGLKELSTLDVFVFCVNVHKDAETSKYQQLQKCCFISSFILHVVAQQRVLYKNDDLSLWCSPQNTPHYKAFIPDSSGRKDPDQLG